MGQPVPPVEALPRATLARAGYSVSRIVLGCYGFGDVAPAAASARSDQTMVDTLNAAFAEGVTVLDSADIYGNEARLGRLLPQTDAPAGLVVHTKFGGVKGFTADGIRASAERSLQNLGLARLPMLFVHDPRTRADMDVVLGRGGALEGLRALQSEGLVEHVGVATTTLPPLRIAVDSGEFDCIQVPALYTLLVQALKTSGLLSAAKAKRLGVFVTSPYGGNLLATGSAVQRPLYYYMTAPADAVDAVRRMERECRRIGTTLPEAAIAFPLAEPMIDAVVVGATTPRDIVETCARARSRLTAAQLDAIAAAGQIDERILGGPDFVTHYPPDRPPPEAADE